MAYFSNGSEGMVLDAQCAKCKIPNDAPCPILFVQMNYNYEQFTDGKRNKISEVLDSLVDKEGNCRMKPILDQL
jgi:hypothetical protein